MRFDQIIGNPQVKEWLDRTIAVGQVHSALLFAGPARVGKRTLAVALAQRLNCKTPTQAGGCGTCPPCRQISAGSYPDVRLVQAGITAVRDGNEPFDPDERPGARGTAKRKPSEFIRIAQVRDVIQHLSFRPFGTGARVMIFDEADRMNAEAANALLKTLEEPPAQTILVLTTAAPHRLLPTIRSRCAVLPFIRVPADAIAGWLSEHHDCPPEEAGWAARLANGSPGQALALDLATLRDQRTAVLDALHTLLEGGNHQAFAAATALKGVSDDLPITLDLLKGILRDLMLLAPAPEGAESRARFLLHQDLLGSLTEGLASLRGAPGRAAYERVDRVQRALGRNLYSDLGLRTLCLEVQAAASRPPGAGDRLRA